MKQTSNISEQEYTTLKAKYDTYHAAREELCQGRNYVTVEEQELLPPSPSHDEISAVEVYEFRNDPPARYFAYVNCQGNYPSYITTWTGEILGEVLSFGASYHSNMGDVRQNITVKAINGKRYTGTYFKSSGDYCRLKVMK
jgi:hypothetical protein